MRGVRLPKERIIIPERVAARAATRFVVDERGCHISTYSVASHGYAQIGWADGDYRQVVTAHRAAWVHVNGQIPEGMTVDHLCKGRRCVNVDHLRLLSNYENARRTSGRDWPLGECVNGHSNDHLFLADGGRKVRCRICVQETQRRYRQKRRLASTRNFLE